MNAAGLPVKPRKPAPVVLVTKPKTVAPINMRRPTSEDVLLAFKTFDAVASTNKRKEKLDLLLEIKRSSACAVVRDFLRLALDPTLVFNIKPPDLASLKVTARLTPLQAWEAAFVLANRLSVRDISGNAARAELAALLSDIPRDNASCMRRWISGMFEKKIRMGVDTLVHDVFPGLIKIFDVPKGAALVKQGTGQILPNVKKRLKYPLISQPKHDGYSCPVEIDLDANKAVALTSGGNELPALQPYADAVLERIHRIGIPPIFTRRFLVDAEVTAVYGDRTEDSYWESAWGKVGALIRFDPSIKPKKDAPSHALMTTMIEDDITLSFYDIYPYEAMFRPFDIKYSTREAALKALFGRKPPPGIALTAGVVCNSWEETQVQHRKWVALGYEGSIYRMDDSPIYAAGSRCRDNYVKQKDYSRHDAIILGVTEGTGKFAGAAGAFVCWVPDRKSVTKSTVLSDALRKWVWKHRQELLGYNVEITMDKSVAGDAAASRNPVARFRDDQQPVFGAKLLAMYKAADITPPKNFPTMPFHTFHKELAAMATA